jgi:hypothetical protein
LSRAKTKEKKMLGEIDVETKKRIRNTGHSAADLSRALNIPYQTLASHLCGYTHADANLQSKIRNKIKEWEKEIEERAAEPESNRQNLTAPNK